MMLILLTLKAWWSGLAHFLSTPVGRVIATLAVAVIAVLVAYQGGVRAGVKAERLAHAERAKKAQEHVAKVEKAGAVITADVAKTLVKTRTEIQYRTKLQIEKVIEYVPVESDAACTVGVGALRLHDHAFAGLPGLPSPPGGSLQADSGVPLSALIADDVAFAGTAYDWQAEVIAWRAWYSRHADLWAKSIKAPDKTP